MLSALSAAAIIIGAVCVPGARWPGCLSLRPLVWIGHHLLWRLPVALPGLRLPRRRPDRPRPASPCWPSASPATFALAAASYYLVERPVMYGTFWRSLKAIGPATALMVATVAVVVVGHRGAGHRRRCASTGSGCRCRTHARRSWWCWGTARPNPRLSHWPPPRRPAPRWSTAASSGAAWPSAPSVEHPAAAPSWPCSPPATRPTADR